MMLRSLLHDVQTARAAVIASRRREGIGALPDATHQSAVQIGIERMVPTLSRKRALSRKTGMIFLSRKRRSLDLPAIPWHRSLLEPRCA
jgi:hypothetical protein